MRGPTTRQAWAAELIRHASLVRPPGEGPHPLTIQLHGCGGPRPFLKEYTEAALASGVAALSVDSFAPRGLSRVQASALVCTGVLLRGHQRAADVYALYDWARRQDWVDPDRIALAGWSHGAWAIMDALALAERAPAATKLTDLPGDPLKGLAAAFLVYPYAAYPALTTARGWTGARPRVSAVVCGKDQVVGHRHPARAFDRLERDGLEVERLILADATHAFEDQGASDPRSRFRRDLFDQTKAWYALQLAKAFASRG